MKGKINYKFSTKDCWGKLRYFTHTLLTEIPTDAHGFTLMNECCKLAIENEKNTPNFYQLLWVKSSALKEAI